MVYFRKRLTPEVLGEINEMIIRDAKAHQNDESKDDDGENPDYTANRTIEYDPRHL